VIVRFPFAQLPAYGSPNPEGVAVCHIDVTGDVSGGAISGGMTSIGQFIYRLELLQLTRGDLAADDVDYVTFHQWATAKSGFGTNAFDLNWHFESRSTINFGLYRPFDVDLRMIRRFPLGRTDDVGASFIIFYQNLDNADGIAYDVDGVFTYWRKEALLQPGFLQAFYEAPFVPILSEGSPQ